MYIQKIWNYFLSKTNKTEYLWICFCKSIERGTLFIGFCISLWIITKFNLDLTFAKNISHFLDYYIFIAIPIYGVFREINFDYKATNKKI